MIPDLALYPDRCSRGYHLTTQHPTLCDCMAGTRGKERALAAVNDAAEPNVRQRIDAAILKVAARGQTFSANDVRPLLPDDLGPLMGARFNSLARAGVIVRVGYEPSSKGNTHAHEIKTWRSAA